MLSQSHYFPVFEKITELMLKHSKILRYFSCIWYLLPLARYAAFCSKIFKPRHTSLYFLLSLMLNTVNVIIPNGAVSLLENGRQFPTAEFLK